MCFEILELRDLTCDLFQAFLAKLSWENGFTKNLGQNQTSQSAVARYSFAGQGGSFCRRAASQRYRTGVQLGKAWERCPCAPMAGKLKSSTVPPRTSAPKPGREDCVCAAELEDEARRRCELPVREGWWRCISNHARNMAQWQCGCRHYVEL